MAKSWSEKAFFLAVVGIWIIIIILIPVFIVLNQNFTESDKIIGMIQTLDNACLTVSSVVLAAILAIVTLMVDKPANKKIDGVLNLAILPIAAIICGLFSLFTSYFDFNHSKFLLAVTMEFTIAGIVGLYLLFTYKKDSFIPENKTP